MNLKVHPQMAHEYTLKSQGGYTHTTKTIQMTKTPSDISQCWNNNKGYENYLCQSQVNSLTMGTNYASM